MLPYRVSISGLLAPTLGFGAPFMSSSRVGLDSKVFAARGPLNLRTGSEAPLMGLHSLSKTKPGTELPIGAPPKRGHTTSAFLEVSAPSALPSPGSGVVGGPSHRPDSLASSGFLNLLTLSSARSIPALFHASYAHGVHPSELCSSRAGGSRLRCRCPLAIGNRSVKPRDLGRQSSQLPRICANAHPTPG